VTHLDISKALADSEENLEILNKKIIHIIPTGYKLDGKDIHGRPEGMKGVKLEVKTLFITCLKQNIEDLITALGLAGYEKSLRIRDKGSVREVNFKKRSSFSKGVHAKKEVQFEISDIKGFFELIEDFGFRRWLHKEKTTELYRTKDGVHIELNFVKKLGWFLELEVLCSIKQVSSARNKVVALRNKLGFRESDCEPRGYTKQLWGLKNKG
jgi:predicted adenylyl cyclase CyaB